MLDSKLVRKDFLIYNEHPSLVYLDNGATALKPLQVLNKMNEYYTKYGVNVHRGVYGLSYQATDEYDIARTKISKFINSKFEEVIFVRNASEGLNLVALLNEDKIEENDEIVSSYLEHHSSVLPWMMIAKRKKALIKYINLTSDGRITIEEFKKTISPKTKVVCLNYYSNVLGYRTPVEEIIKICHENNIICIIDAAQAVAHEAIDVKKLDCDYLVFSGHKMMGPTGIGVVYGKYNLLKKLPPLYYGGDMNEDVNPTDVEVKDPPFRFEAGTPMVAEAIGLGEAVDYITKIGFDKIKEHTKELYDYTIDKLKDLEGLTIYNINPELPIIAFNIDGVHPHDAATLFDEQQICLRAGHHCAQLLTKWLNCVGTLRGSFYIYNDYNDCDIFINTVIEAIKFFKKINEGNYE